MGTDPSRRPVVEPPRLDLTADKAVHPGHPQRGVTGLLRLISLLFAACLAVVMGCPGDPDPTIDSETHWLTECSTTADCGIALDCICGTCTVACDEAADCSAIGSNAVCVQIAEVGAACEEEPAETGGLCTFTCRGDGDCYGSGPNTMCTQGTCLPPAPSDTDFLAAIGAEQCPVAEPRARILGSWSGWETDLAVMSGITVELDGSQSRAAGGIASYSWHLAERPAGSLASVGSDSRPEHAEVELDLVGSYVFELTVFDNEGTPSCEAAAATATAFAGEGIVIEMTRPTDEEPGRVTSGTPLEIHFLHRYGRWTEDPWDCTVDNPTPNWGDAASATDDPLLYLGSAEDLLPSVITLREPENIPRYKLGAYCPTAPEPVQCRVVFKVFLDGVESTLESPAIFESGTFWDALDIDWEERTVGSFDRVYENGIPGAETD